MNEYFKFIEEDDTNRILFFKTGDWKLSKSLIIPRNYKVEEALNLATNDMNFNSFHDLLEVLKKPYDNQKNIEGYQFVPNTTSQVYKTYCGT